MIRKLAVLEASGQPGGAGEALAPPDGHVARHRELVARLRARDAGAVEALDCGCEGDASRGKILQTYTRALAARTSELVGAREFPLVLGGPCSTLVGNMLGLRSLGRYGLVFVDGHDDFSYVRDRERHCGFFAAAGLDLAIATGNGPDAFSNLNGLKPYVDERHVVLIGMYSHPSDAIQASAALDERRIQQFRLDRIREIGTRAAAEQALAYLAEQEVDGFWIHVDADVLERQVGPDASGADGLDFQELSEALGVFLASDLAAGMELTLDDPEMDPDGDSGDRLVESIVRAFAPPGRGAA